MAAARLRAVERVDTHQLGNFEKVRDTRFAFSRAWFNSSPAADDAEIMPELITQLRDSREGLSQARL